MTLRTAAIVQLIRVTGFRVLFNLPIATEYATLMPHGASYSPYPLSLYAHRADYQPN